MEFVIRPFAASDKDWLVDQHIRHYGPEDGFDATFGPFIADIVDLFLAKTSGTGRAGWLAQHGTERLGTIFCDRKSETCAQLRLFYVVPRARGAGVAQALIDTCVSFAKAEGYQEMVLWTLASKAAAGGIYARNGFVMVAEKSRQDFGAKFIEQTWQIAL